jgi:hypothetical protein
VNREYLVLGVVVIGMSIGQIWLRHGPGSKDLRPEPKPGADPRAARVWNAWTAVLGGIGIALGIVLVVLGVLGR